MTDTEPDISAYLTFVHAVLTEPVPNQSPAGRVADLTDAVRHAEELIAEFAGHDVSEARFYAAWAHDDLFHLTGEVTYLDREIEHLRALPAEDATELLVDALSTRQEARDDGLDDIDEALRLQRGLVSAGPAARVTLGLLVAQRFRASPPDDPDQLAELDEALALLSEAEHSVPPDDPDRARVVTVLGHLYVMSHLAPHMRPGKPHATDLDRGIDLLRSVADYDTEAADRLAFALDRRFSEQKRPADRDEAITILERLCARLPGYLDACAVELGALHLERLEEEPTQEVFERTVEVLEHALRQRLPDTEYLHVYLINAYLLRWGRVPPEELDRLRATCAELAGADQFLSDMLLLIDVEKAVVADDPELIRLCATRLTDELTGPYREDKDVGTLAGLLAALVAQLHGAGHPWAEWSPFVLGAKASVEDGTELLDWLRSHRVADHALFATGLALLAAHLPVPPEETVAELEHALGLLPPDHPTIAEVEYELGRRNLGHDEGIELDRRLALLSDAARKYAPDDPARARCLGTLGMTLFSAYTDGLVRQDAVARADELISEALTEAAFEVETHAGLLVAQGIVRGMRWLVDPAHGDMRTGMALLEQALSLLPPDHQLRLDIRFSMANLLLARSLLTRNVDEITAAEAHLLAVQPLVSESNEFATPDAVASMLRTVRLTRGMFGGSFGDSAEYDDIISEMAAQPNRDHDEERLLLYAQFARAHHRGDVTEALRLMERLGDSTAAFPAHLPFRTTIQALAALGTAAKAVVRDDRPAFDDVAANLTAAVDATGTSTEERAQLLHMIGGMWSSAHNQWREPHLRDKAIAALEECRELRARTVEPIGMHAAEELSTLYWKRRGPGDEDRALERGFTALREHARQVLLHEELAHGAGKASTMADTAHVLAHRCVAAGRPELAVAAVENGRALAMHAATSDVGAALRALGHDTVALEWEHSVRRRQDRVGIPTDLRYRVLALLAGTDEERRLLSAPSSADIAGALREIGADVLAYLVPAVGDEPSRALFVTSGGRLGVVPLAVGKGDEVDRYLTAYRSATSEGGHAVDRWRAELGELVRWAWPSVVGPLLDALGGEASHVVLVPCGALGVVPWHAACDGTTFAIQQATFSYVASARQLCDVATRPTRDPAEAPVVVADPTGDLHASTREARYLYEHCYPHGEYFGFLPEGVPRDGAGSPSDVLAVLPHASLLHLACHAENGAHPAASHVKLTDRLTVTQVLRHKADHQSGGLVVLAACASDLTDREHDEALTLATAFLAAGAGSVVGTRWAVDDQRAAVLMCLFHRHLTVDGLPPAQALRAAQLWALDRNQDLPADIAAVLGTTRPEIPLTTWAAFSHQGR